VACLGFKQRLGGWEQWIQSLVTERHGAFIDINNDDRNRYQKTRRGTRSCAIMNDFDKTRDDYRTMTENAMMNR